MDKVELTDQHRREILPEGEIPTLYRPTHDYLLVKAIPELESKGMIFIPERARIEYHEGHIVAKGPTSGEQWTVGDCVCWNPSGAMKVEADNGEKLVLLLPSAIFLKIPKQALIDSANKRINWDAPDPKQQT